MSSLSDNLCSIGDRWVIEAGRYVGNRLKKQGFLSTQGEARGGGRRLAVRVAPTAQGRSAGAPTGARTAARARRLRGGPCRSRDRTAAVHRDDRWSGDAGVDAVARPGLDRRAGCGRWPTGALMKAHRANGCPVSMQPISAHPRATSLRSPKWDDTRKGKHGEPLRETSVRLPDCFAHPSARKTHS